MNDRKPLGAGYGLLRAVLVTLVLAVALLSSAVAKADSQLTHGFLRYEVEDNSVTIVDYAGEEEEVWVPTYIAGKPVNRIAMGAFYDSWTVGKVYLPDTVTQVDEGAFAEDQEVIFDWNVGEGAPEDDEGDEKKDDSSKNGNTSTSTTPESNTVRNTGTATSSTAGSTKLSKTGDDTSYALPAVLVFASLAALVAAARIRMRRVR